MAMSSELLSTAQMFGHAALLGFWVVKTAWNVIPLTASAIATEVMFRLHGIDWRNGDGEHDRGDERHHHHSPAPREGL